MHVGETRRGGGSDSRSCRFGLFVELGVLRWSVREERLRHSRSEFSGAEGSAEEWTSDGTAEEMERSCTGTESLLAMETPTLSSSA